MGILVKRIGDVIAPYEIMKQTDGKAFENTIRVLLNALVFTLLPPSILSIGC